MTTGQAIRELRERLQWTQQGLAHETALAVRTVSVYENDKTTVREDILMRFARIAADNGFADLIDALFPDETMAATRELYEVRALWVTTLRHVERTLLDLDRARKCAVDLQTVNRQGETTMIEIKTGAGKSPVMAPLIHELLKSLNRAKSELRKIPPAA